MLKSLLTYFVSGYYVYTEVTNRTAIFADAHLVSPFFRQAGKTCKFQFWYHMWGRNIGYLQVYYRRNSRDKRLFNIFGNRGNQWNKGMVDIPKCASDFQVSGFRQMVKGGKILGKILGHIIMFHAKMFYNGGRRILVLVYALMQMPPRVTNNRRLDFVRFQMLFDVVTNKQRPGL